MFESSKINIIQTFPCSNQSNLMNNENSINAIEIFLDITEEMSFSESSSDPQECYKNTNNTNLNNTTSTPSFDLYELADNSEKTDILDLENDHLYISQKQNQIKNLLNSFKNHISGTQDTYLMEKYCQLYQSNGISFTNLKKIVLKRTKDKNTRWNMKLKSFLKSSHLKSVFFYYLKYESMNWLNNSKVQEKNALIELIQKLITFQQNDQILDEIKTYKK